MNQKGKQSIRFPRHRNLLPHRIWTLVCSALLLCAAPLYAQNRLCFPSTTWFGSPAGPSIDGNILFDQGWRGGFRYISNNGSPTPDVVIQGIRDTATQVLYLSIEADNLDALYCDPMTCTNPYPSTIVLLTFDAGPTATPRFHQLEIHPVRNAAYFMGNATAIKDDPSDIAKPPLGVISVTPINYYSGADTTTWTQKTTPTWAPSNMKVGYLKVGSLNYRWYLEVKIPFKDTDNITTQEAIVPATGNFALYINVLRVVGGNYQQSWWPPTAPVEGGCVNVGISCNPHSQTPTVGNWGASTVDPNPMLTCGGVSVGSQVNDIFTDNTPSSKISLDNPNTFHAYVQNTSVDGSGNFIVAQKVRSTFKIANFGLPSLPSWSKVPTGILAILNITQTAMNSGTATYTWSLSPGSGTAPTTGQTPLVTVTGTNNGAGIFNVTDKPTTNWVGTTSTTGTFQVAGLAGTVTAAAETGQGTVTPNPATNPTPYKDIPASACTVTNDASCELSTGQWSLLPVQQTAYQSANQGHQCILAELDSDPGLGSNTTILNNAAVQNMDFGLGASTFERVAEISAKGYPPRPPNPDGTENKDQLFDLHIVTRQEILNSGQTASAYNQATAQTSQGGGKTEGRVISQLTWVAHGCRHTGRFMFVDDHKIELCDPVGAFGYVVRHKGKAPVKNWNLRLTGSTLKAVPGRDNTYQVRVAQDGVATVTTLAEPKEEGRTGGHFALFLDAGVSFPHGTFGQVFDHGFSLNAGLEYILASHFSVEGIFGYHHFPGTITPALDIYQFSGNAKAYLTTGTFQPFVNGGIGGYRFSVGSGSSSTYFGGNVGAGVLYNLTPRFGVQGSYNFHVINTPSEATKFSTLQGGIRFVF